MSKKAKSSENFLFGGGKVDEPALCDFIHGKDGIVNVHGKFISADGFLPDSVVSGIIAKMIIELGIKERIANLTKNIRELYGLRWQEDEVIPSQWEIPVANGTITVSKEDATYSFFTEKHLTPYRLPISYDPKAGKTETFSKLLNSLFVVEDRTGFQQWMGTTLIPNNMGQKMLILLGKGGEGKSTMLNVLDMMLGQAYTPIKIHKLNESLYTLATLENKLVAGDDDLECRSVKFSGNQKTVISADGRVIAERKFINEFEFRPYCKLIACGNFMLTSLGDNSEGFFRRLYPIQVKAKDVNRVNDPFMKEKISKETSAILNWMLEGLMSFISNGFEYSISSRSRDLLTAAQDSGDPIGAFLRNSVIYTPSVRTSTDDLYDAYVGYCVRYNEPYGTKTALSQYMKKNQAALGIKYICPGNFRGFSGIKVKPLAPDLVAILGKEGAL